MQFIAAAGGSKKEGERLGRAFMLFRGNKIQMEKMCHGFEFS